MNQTPSFGSDDMNINLHIEHLILDGISIGHQQKKALKAAVESALKRQLVGQGIASALQFTSDRQVVKGGLISVKNSHKAENIGQQIANAVYRGIKK